MTRYEWLLLNRGWRRGKVPGPASVPPTPAVVIAAADRWADRDRPGAERMATDTDRMQALLPDGSVTP